MSTEIAQLQNKHILAQLKEIPDPPDKLYIKGAPIPTDNKLLTVVGSRAASRYGKDVCKNLIHGLKHYPISIVSGLAIGIDSIAHRAALDTGLHTIAVPGSGLDESVLYPSSNKNLAKEIIKNGGTLLSEFEPDFRATKWSFPQRNRIMVGLCDATLIIEATAKSGTLITARLATDYNRELLAVPHSIGAPNGEGPNMFLRLGATLIRSPEDILEALHLEVDVPANAKREDLTQNEKVVFESLSEPLTKDEIVRKTGTPASEISSTLMSLELKEAVREIAGKFTRSL